MTTGSASSDAFERDFGSNTFGSIQVQSNKYFFDSGVGGLAFFILMLAIYFGPTLIAFHRKHPNRIPIFLLNLVCGWTFIGWIAALMWASTAESKKG